MDFPARNEERGTGEKSYCPRENQRFAAGTRVLEVKEAPHQPVRGFFDKDEVIT